MIGPVGFTYSALLRPAVSGPVLSRLKPRLGATAVLSATSMRASSVLLKACSARKSSGDLSRGSGEARPYGMKQSTRRFWLTSSSVPCEFSQSLLMHKQIPL